MPTIERNHRPTQVEEIMGKKPQWVVRWGIIVLIFVFSLFIMIAQILPYEQYVESDIILSLDTTKQPNYYHVQLTMPAHKIANIQKGQEIIFELDAFPRSEWGIFQSTVTNNPILQSRNEAFIHFGLPAPLVSSQKRVLLQHLYLHGKARIIMHKGSILSFIYD